MPNLNSTRMFSVVAMTALSALVVLGDSDTATAQAPTAPVYVYQQPVQPTAYVAQPTQAVVQQQPVQYVTQQPAQAQPAQTAQVATGDPYGFTGWLNSVRAQYGLPAVGYDPNLESWAAANNAQQNARGIGHFVMGPARRQNCAMGGFGSIGSMWLASPAHRAALLDPSIRFIGLAGAGAYWTFNAY
ncbi:MAG TPA: CAP domain-containing protein [Isosphaeraceae bacterium]|nr:CAP domain-containing protein [Isosphaeraceae bacterium]